MSEAKLKRQHRDFANALADMTDAAMALADSIIGMSPDRPVTDEELARVEDFIVDHLVSEGRKNVTSGGGGSIALGFGAGAFRQMFAARLRDQARLKAAEPRGTA